MIYSSKSALPSEWDKRQWGRHQAAQQYLKVDGLQVKYTGPGETDSQAASIFADHAVPQDVPLYYFEISVVNKGAQGFIGIGFCAEDVNLGRLPGWEPRSYGYHGDDGHAFHGSGTGRPFGPGFTTGDVVGALLDRGLNTISFFKNGEPVGTAFYGVQEQQLYPCVGMRTANEEIRANFGATPFAVDLAALQQQFRQRILDSISAVKLPAAVELAELGPGNKSPDEEELLSDALSLLAYAEPAASPCGHLLRAGQRLQLAEELNGALLQARGTSAQPLLESVYRQAVGLLDELKRQGSPAALVLDVPKLCLSGPATAQQQQRKGLQAGSSAAAAAAAAAGAAGSVQER
ncbi:hypothetical protein OEZ85_002076 [Tetradesmus obliquus]|uniref:B30.2/SPRY domain-containing protein n=1 Tax=Tetradesmus obliquus TaxID=3088 RepID=A0ABY8U2I4_TETOB|nr:hypothetical protein OEZ85_002076 [Tetradesmus obliquus]